MTREGAFELMRTATSTVAEKVVLFRFVFYFLATDHFIIAARQRRHGAVFWEVFPCYSTI